MRISTIAAGVAVVLVLCAVSFLVGVLAGGIVGPSPRAFIAAITTPDARPAASESALATPRYGYKLSAGCVFTPIGDTGVYFDPENRRRICVLPPEATIEPGSEPTPGEGAQIPPNCGVAPDQNIYCSPGWPMDFSFLQRLYERGELPLAKP